MTKVIKSILVAMIFIGVIIGIAVTVEFVKISITTPVIQKNVIHAADFQYFDIDGKHYFQFELEGMICVEKVGYSKSLSCVEHGN